MAGDKEKKYVTLTGFPNSLWDAKVGPLARPEISDPVGVSRARLVGQLFPEGER